MGSQRLTVGKYYVNTKLIFVDSLETVETSKMLHPQGHPSLDRKTSNFFNRKFQEAWSDISFDLRRTEFLLFVQ